MWWYSTKNNHQLYIIVYLYMYAIMNGHIKLKDLKDDPTNEYGLDEMKTQGESFVCENILTCLVWDVDH